MFKKGKAWRFVSIIFAVLCSAILAGCDEDDKSSSSEDQSGNANQGSQIREVKLVRGQAEWAVYQLGWESEWQAIDETVNFQVSNESEIGIAYYCDGLNVYFFQAGFFSDVSAENVNVLCEEDTFGGSGASELVDVSLNVNALSANLRSRIHLALSPDAQSQRAHIFKEGFYQFFALENYNNENASLHWTEDVYIDCALAITCEYSYALLEKETVAPLDRRFTLDFQGHGDNTVSVLPRYMSVPAWKGLSLAQVESEFSKSNTPFASQESELMYLSGLWQESDTDSVDLKTSSNTAGGLDIYNGFIASVSEEIDLPGESIFNMKTRSIAGLFNTDSGGIDLSFPDRGYVLPSIDLDAIRVDLHGLETALSTEVEVYTFVLWGKSNIRVEFSQKWLASQGDDELDLSFLETIAGWDASWLSPDYIHAVRLTVELSNADGAFGTKPNVIIKPYINWSNYSLSWTKE